MPAGIVFDAEESAAIWTWRNGSPIFGISKDTPNSLRLEANCGGSFASLPSQNLKTPRLLAKIEAGMFLWAASAFLIVAARGGERETRVLAPAPLSRRAKAAKPG